MEKKLSYTFTVPKPYQKAFAKGVKILRKCHRRAGGGSTVTMRNGDEVTIDLNGPLEVQQETIGLVAEMDELLSDHISVMESVRL